MDYSNYSMNDDDGALFNIPVITTSRNDVKAGKEFAKSFYESISKAHTSSGSEIYNSCHRTSIMKELRNLEIGNNKKCRRDRIIPSLLHNPNRQFDLDYEYSFKADRDMKMDKQFVYGSEGILSIQDGTYRNFPPVTPEFSYVVPTERPQENDYEFHYGNDMGKYKYLPILTSVGQLHLYDTNGPELKLVYRFNLPAHLYNFKFVDWNKNGSELYVVGRSIRQMIGDDQRRHMGLPMDMAIQYIPSYCIFSLIIEPIVRVRCLIELNQNQFGALKSATLRDDALICISSDLISIYDFKKMFNEYCTYVPSSHEYGDPLSDRVIRFNVKIPHTIPHPIISLKGSYNTLDIGCLPHHILLQSYRIKVPYHLVRCDGVKPIRTDGFKLHGSHEGTPIGIFSTDGTTFFHPDQSNRLLRYEGYQLCCYTIESNPSIDSNHLPSTLPFDWSTQVIPQCRHEVFIRNTSFYPGDLLAVMIQVRLNNTNEMINHDNLMDFSMIVFMDSLTGRVIRVTHVDNSVDDDYGKTLLLDGSLISVGLAETNDRRKVRIHRLVDISQFEKSEDELIRPKSTILNRKQKRQLRKQERRGRINYDDEIV